MAEMVLEVSHGDEAAAVARAHLAEWAARHVPDLADDLLLVVSELVTNAAVHGPAEPITLHLDASGPGRLRGEVVDQGDRPEAVAVRAPDEEGGGLGLVIVDRLAADWGVTAGSTRVWFILGG
jgi:anti-sigma regulatory factor (Ser/Thr protein kinase)